MFNIKDFTCIPSNQLRSLQDATYSRVWLIKPYDKFTCYNEDDLYDLEKKLNNMGCETRIARNLESGTLSVAILSVPTEQCLVVPEIKIIM